MDDHCDLYLGTSHPSDGNPTYTDKHMNPVRLYTESLVCIQLHLKHTRRYLSREVRTRQETRGLKSEVTSRFSFQAQTRVPMAFPLASSSAGKPRRPGSLGA